MEDVKIALQLEKDGYKYYKEASERCKNEYGKKMFEKLANDEVSHLKKFRKIAENIFGEIPEDEGKHLDIFEKIDFSTRAGEYLAIDHAIAFEERARQFFVEASKKSKDQNIRKLFDEIAKEEEMHKALLEAEKSFIHKSGIWFDYQEFYMDGL